MSSNGMEMPKYKCHKEVWALKIKSITYGHNDDWTPIEGCLITPGDFGYAPFVMSMAWHDKHRPEPGGYYVRYKDGYQSYSPSSEFEDGYSLIS